MAEEEIEVTTEYAHHEELMNAFGVIAITIFLIALTIVHGRKMYQDFYTQERASLDHRNKNKPKLTAGYRNTGWLTFGALFFYLILAFSQFIQYNLSSEQCWVVWTVPEKIAYFGSKTCIYLTYVFRLKEIYGQSAYGYGVGKLKCAAVVIVAWNVSLYLLFQIAVILLPFAYQDTDNTFPHYCQMVPQHPWKTYIGGGILLFDLISAITSIVFFNRPLLKLVEAARIKSDKSVLQNRERDKRFGKMLYIGFKYKVLVWTASFTTLLWIVIMFASAQGIATFIILIDYLVNPVTVLLMTPYYPSNKYYEPLCFLCIKCCDTVQNNTHKSEAAIEDRDQRRLQKNEESEVSGQPNISQPGLDATPPTNEARTETI